MFEWLTSPEAWIALGTLTALEIVLGIDNIIFISILVGRLPESQRAFARRMGLGLAMIARLGLLFSISWVMGLTEPLVTVFTHAISGRDIILVGGGLFLLAKATHEIHNSLEGLEEESGHTIVAASCQFGNGSRPDCASGYCVFIGFGYHGGRPGRSGVTHGHRHYSGCARDAHGGKSDWRFCGRASDD